MSAATLADSDPEEAFSLAYDAARRAATALVVRQGLRLTTAGDHLAVVDAINAQVPSVPASNLSASGDRELGVALEVHPAGLGRR